MNSTLVKLKDIEGFKEAEMDNKNNNENKEKRRKCILLRP